MREKKGRKETDGGQVRERRGREERERCIIVLHFSAFPSVVCGMDNSGYEVETVRQ